MCFGGGFFALGMFRRFGTRTRFKGCHCRGGEVHGFVRAQRLLYPLIKEYHLKYFFDYILKFFPYCKVYYIIKGYWSLWVLICFVWQLQISWC